MVVAARDPFLPRRTLRRGSTRRDHAPERSLSDRTRNSKHDTAVFLTSDNGNR
ncbi:hypothetical protein NJ7G_3694 [Natrinema sp. J7-2]|nr:hypothetical protein NJ7G_3694 [Natrinema sp. J7-2]